MSRVPIVHVPAGTRWAGRARAVLGIALVAAAIIGWAVLLPPAATAAASPPLRFSADGHTWTAQPDPLFQDAVITPGGRTTASLWVRHHGSGAARLAVTAAENDLTRWFTVQVNAVDIAPGETSLGPVLQAGDPLRLDFQVTLDPETPLSARNSTAQLLSHLTIRALPEQDVPPVAEGPASPPRDDALEPHPSAGTGHAAPSGPTQAGDRPPSGLPAAGSTALWLLAAAFMLVWAGRALRRRSQRA